MSDDFFAPPPFDPATALVSLRKTLRDLKLSERGGAFEWKDQPVLRVRVEETGLALEIAKRLARSPDWERVAVRDHAQLRRIIDDLKRRIDRWSDGRDD